MYPTRRDVFTLEPNGVTEPSTAQIEAAKLVVHGYDREDIAAAVGCTIEEVETWVLFSPAFEARVELEAWFLHQQTVARRTMLTSDTIDALEDLVDHKATAVAQALRDLRVPEAPPPPRTIDQVLEDRARARAVIANQIARDATRAEINPLCDQVLVDDVSAGIIDICRNEVAAARRKRPRPPAESEPES